MTQQPQSIYLYSTKVQRDRNSYINFSSAFNFQQCNITPGDGQSATQSHYELQGSAVLPTSDTLHIRHFPHSAEQGAAIISFMQTSSSLELSRC